jgi:hypothetical protein
VIGRQVGEPAEIDRLVSASIGGGQPIYRLDTDAIRDLRPNLVLSHDLCAVCTVPFRPAQSGPGRPRLPGRGRLPEFQLAGRRPGRRRAAGRQGRQGPGTGPRGRRRAAEAARQRPRRRGRAGADLGVRAGVGPSAVQRRPLGAGDAAGRRGRGPACLSGWSLGAGELGADRRRSAAVVVFMPCGYGLQAAVDEARRTLGPWWRDPSCPVSRRPWRSMPAPTALVRVPAWWMASRSSPPRSTRNGSLRHQLGPLCDSGDDLDQPSPGACAPWMAALIQPGCSP